MENRDRPDWQLLTPLEFTYENNINIITIHQRVLSTLTDTKNERLKVLDYIILELLCESASARNETTRIYYQNRVKEYNKRKEYVMNSELDDFIRITTTTVKNISEFTPIQYIFNPCEPSSPALSRSQESLFKPIAATQNKQQTISKKCINEVLRYSSDVSKFYPLRIIRNCVRETSKCAICSSKLYNNNDINSATRSSCYSCPNCGLLQRLIPKKKKEKSLNSRERKDFDSIMSKWCGTAPLDISSEVRAELEKLKTKSAGGKVLWSGVIGCLLKMSRRDLLPYLNCIMSKIFGSYIPKTNLEKICSDFDVMQLYLNEKKATGDKITMCIPFRVMRHLITEGVIKSKDHLASYDYFGLSVKDDFLQKQNIGWKAACLATGIPYISM